MNFPPELLASAKEALSKVPQEDLFAVCMDAMERFSTIRSKFYSNDQKDRDDATQETQELKEYLKAKLRDLYRNVGIDFDTLITSLAKNINKKEQDLII